MYWRATRWFDRLLALRLPQGAGTLAVVLFLVAAALFGAVRGGHGPSLSAELRDMRDAVANMAGFRITAVALAGARQLTREQVLDSAGVTDRRSLLFLDAAAARDRLKANPWIADATVLKLYPGRLHIKVVEREAFALWQKDGQVVVIAEDGHVVQSHVERRFAHLPLFVGAGAQTRAKAFLSLIDRQPSISHRLEAAVLVAERRWNLRLKGGIDVRLPESGVAGALDALVRLDRNHRLLSRDIAVVDLRLPDRVTVRLTESAAQARAEALKPRPKPRGGDA